MEEFVQQNISLSSMSEIYSSSFVCGRCYFVHSLLLPVEKCGTNVDDLISATVLTSRHTSSLVNISNTPTLIEIRTHCPALQHPFGLEQSKWTSLIGTLDLNLAILWYLVLIFSIDTLCPLSAPNHATCAADFRDASDAPTAACASNCMSSMT
ncbi:uncharacterized protein BDZ99DRAFT_293636 [Mytilinidion resinicola]|uniref:Uncharacterized protein n=1 Tax=Mytilinidion resinicola TaxID=574789 RepID=A0A6A6YR52_9PEZI|nr:uncharacterized protein BDZ99DRAFT_293636 [Mytilinidion resinicola]KAF2811028.1 hypothetical protein BDZ99DRAFT_293636 [Mytilinidion resinicola]